MADQLKQALTRLFSIIIFAVAFFFVSKIPLGDAAAETVTLVQTIATILGGITGKGVADWLIKQFNIGIGNS